PGLVREAGPARLVRDERRGPLGAEERPRPAAHERPVVALGRRRRDGRAGIVRTRGDDLNARRLARRSEPRPGLDDLRPRRAVEPERVGERGAPAAGADVHELRRARHRPLDGWTAAEAVVEVIGDEEVRAGPAEEAGGVGLVGEKL